MTDYSGYIQVTFEDMNNELATIGAKVTTRLKCLQHKAPGYAGEAFAASNKPIYDFQIVDNDGKSFANIHSYLYRSDGGETPAIIKKYAFGGYYVETTKAIYI